mmetsp:Transcript_48773/g.81037  ORF Transcript_48773/g.81037 Transcript_48773/m.81037 type:complete len:83 (+) Transcript_48773:614-862(+)
MCRNLWLQHDMPWSKIYVPIKNLLQRLSCGYHSKQLAMGGVQGEQEVNDAVATNGASDNGPVGKVEGGCRRLLLVFAVGVER